jgi:hypothetical protein
VGWRAGRPDGQLPKKKQVPRIVIISVILKLYFNFFFAECNWLYVGQLAIRWTIGYTLDNWL